jgi:hypothetical protein
MDKAFATMQVAIMIVCLNFEDAFFKQKNKVRAIFKKLIDLKMSTTLADGAQ